jgi:hypothetical protein
MLSRPPKGTPKAPPLTFGDTEWPPRRGRPDLTAERRPWVVETAMLVWPARRHRRPLALGPASEVVARRIWRATPKAQRPWAGPGSLARMLRRDFKRSEKSLERMMRREREIQRIVDREAEVERMLRREHEIQRLVAMVDEVERAHHRTAGAQGRGASRPRKRTPG